MKKRMGNVQASETCQTCQTKPFSSAMLRAAATIDARPLIYMDNNATTKPHPWVERIITTVASRFYGNPSASHVAGKAASFVVEQARAHIARHLHCAPGELLFTSGATEGNNLVLRSLHPGDHAVTSAVEHPATYETCEALKKRGVEVTYVAPIPGSRGGQISVESVLDAVLPTTKLVSLMLANNEVGTVYPVRQIFAQIAARYPRVILHCDATQVLGKLPLDMRRLGADFVTGSAHKFHGPKGVGLLYTCNCSKAKSFLCALCTGGVQEGGVRPGTENVPGIVGMAVAMDCNMLAGAWKEAKARVLGMRDELWVRLHAAVPELVLNTPLESALPNTLSVCFAGVDSRALMASLAGEGICVNVGSACSKGKRSRVLAAIGVSPELEAGVVRFSLSVYNTQEQVRRVVEVLTRHIRAQRKG